MSAVVLVSSLADQQAVTHLLREISEHTVEVRTSGRPAHAFRTAHISQLIAASYYSRWPRPEKVVVLVDANGQEAGQLLSQMESDLRLDSGIAKLLSEGLSLFVAAAQWCVEAWFFADADGLREWLGRDLGNVDLSNPDAIQRPKHHLRNLLFSGKRHYSLYVVAEITQRLQPSSIKARSQSFADFEAKVRNGH